MASKARQRSQEGMPGTSDQKSDRGREEGTPEKRAEVLRFGDLGGKRKKPERYIRVERNIHLPSKCNYGRFYAGQQEFSFSLQTLPLLLSLNPKKVTILFKQRKSLPGPLCMSLQGQKLRTEKIENPSNLREKRFKRR